LAVAWLIAHSASSGPLANHPNLAPPPLPESPCSEAYPGYHLFQNKSRGVGSTACPCAPLTTAIPSQPSFANSSHLPLLLAAHSRAPPPQWRTRAPVLAHTRTDFGTHAHFGALRSRCASALLTHTRTGFGAHAHFGASISPCACAPTAHTRTVFGAHAHNLRRTRAFWRTNISVRIFAPS
jgi:hypothetical protein